MNDVPGLTSSMGATNGDHVRVARQLTAIGNLPASLAPAGFGNNITGGRWPWFDQVINAATVKAAAWYTPLAKNPQNFSSSPIQKAGKKESAVMSEFSFLVLDRLPGVTATGAANWQFQVYDINRKLLRTCTTSGKTASCDG